MQAYKGERCFLLLLLLQGLVGFGLCFADFAELLVRTERSRGSLLSILLRKVSSRIFCNPFSFSRVENCGFFCGGGGGGRVCCLRLQSSLKENFGWVFCVAL
jgi:hypothetical protein